MEHAKNKGNWQGEKTLITVCSKNKRTSELVQEHTGTGIGAVMITSPVTVANFVQWARYP